MEAIEILGASASLLTVVLALLIRNRRSAPNGNDGYLKRLEEVAEDSARVKQACVTSLESMQRSLQALEVRADAAEEKLSGFGDTPMTEREEHYEAAVLLLAGGQSPARVATLLNLPVGQVELVRKLMKVVAGEKAATIQASDGEAAASSKNSNKRRAASKTRPKTRPILLTDAINFADAVGADHVDHMANSNGAAA